MLGLGWDEAKGAHGGGGRLNEGKKKGVASESANIASKKQTSD